jgi:RNase adaptor protein for sRNA GlmZ degradation
MRFKRYCKNCNKLYRPMTKTSQICDKCYEKSKIKSKIVRGYRWVRRKHPNAKNGWVQEHRIIMEKHLERLLTKDECVHHIDCNKLNNKIDNLMLFPNQKEHMKFHTKIKQHGMTEPIKRQIRERWNNL